MYWLVWKVLNWFPAPTERKEWYVRIPLGFWPGRYYRIEHLEHTSGWHWHYLLVVADSKPDMYPGWRVQQQVQHVPLPWTRREREDVL